MSDGLLKLRALLHELFQFDDADLDFGIYRILRMRRQEVERFLQEDLAQRVERAFAHYKSLDRIEEEAARRETIANLRKLRVPEDQIKTNDTVIEHDKRIALAVSRETLQDEVFSRLHDFFSRYYDRGDFLSRRNFRGSTYAVPYAGEEVKLHWANADQYYIKSAARHAHYDFDLPGGLAVRFEVVGGGEERDNAKAAPGLERAYQLDAKPYELQGKKRLVLRFVFRADATTGQDQAWHLGRVAELLKSDAAVMAWGNSLLKTPDDGGRTPLEKHFERFRRSESFDYFIHKDLDGFLRRELDHYLKTEVMRLDDIESLGAARVEEYLSKLKVIRSLAGDIITFLAQVEEFQKRLWLKKKFVLETRWCVSMELVPRALWPEVLANNAQREAWVRLFAIDKIAKDIERVGYSAPLTEEFLAQNPTLVLDTTHFLRDFTDRLLASFDDIEAKTLGTLFHAENFQALQLMQERYQTGIDCVFIDPPYNTGGDDFAYKDGYQHSSWLSMMENRLFLATKLMTSKGVLFATISDDEQPRLRLVGDLVFGAENFVANIVWQKKYSPANDAKWFSDDHDHVVVFARSRETWRPTKLPRSEKQNDAYSNPSNDPRGPWKAGDYTAGKTAEQRPNLYYPILNPTTGESILPTNTWRYSQEQHDLHVASNLVWWGSDGRNKVPAFKRFLTDVGDVVPRTFWSYEDAGHNQDAVREIQAMFGENLFTAPKPASLISRILQVAGGQNVLDFFGGSGTTAHAAIELNRRFLLVEAGPHFDTVLVRRIQKVMHSLDWKDGVPVSRKGPVGIVQVLRLESYDDTLDNLDVTRTPATATLFDKEPDFARDYVLRYMLEHETRESPSLLGLKAFEHPFDRKLRVTRDDASVESPADLVETFHWLLGMTVRRRSVDGPLRISRGTLPDGTTAVVVWRDPATVDAVALEQWFETKALPTLDGVSVVFVNGDAQLERLRPDNAAWRVERIEKTFLERMFPAQQA